jgi:hypothetical protein
MEDTLNILASSAEIEKMPDARKDDGQKPLVDTYDPYFAPPALIAERPPMQSGEYRPWSEL